MEVETFARLNARMLSASIEPALWVDFLDELSSISGGVRTHIFGYDVECDARHPLISSGYEDDYVKSYHDHYHAINEWAYGFAKGAVGQVIASEEMCSSERLRNTEFYNDWVRPQEDIRYGGGTILFKERSRFFALGGNIRTKDGRQKEMMFLRTVKLLAPSLRLAFDISRNVLANRLLESTDKSAKDRGNGDTVILNSKGQIIYVSPTSDHLFSTSGLLKFNSDSRLGLFDQCAELKLYQALSNLRSNLVFFGTELHVESAHRTKFNLRLAAYRPDRLESDRLNLLVSIDEPCLLLVITRATKQKSLFPLLVDLHGFTGAEAEVSELLADFHSPRKISQMRKSSIHTVRNQIKSGMAKMAIRQRSKYILMLCSIRDRHW